MRWHNPVLHSAIIRDVCNKNIIIPAPIDYGWLPASGQDADDGQSTSRDVNRHRFFFFFTIPESTNFPISTTR